MVLRTLYNVKRGAQRTIPRHIKEVNECECICVEWPRAPSPYPAVWWRRPTKEGGLASAPDQVSSGALAGLDGVAMCFKVAMFSLHTSPLASLGRTRDACCMNVYVRELARELGRSGIDVDIFTRRSDPNLPAIHQMAERVRLIQIEAGPVAPLPPAELFPYVGEFTCRVGRFAARAEHPYNLLHTHYWLSAAAALPLAHIWDVPHITMFHTVERLKGQQYGGSSRASVVASAIRIEHEGRIASAVD